jgi:hypothetical protein
MPCQDSCGVQLDQLPNKDFLLSLFVSDGAGSAVKGGEGAELAIEAAAGFIKKKLEQGEFNLTPDLATEMINAIRDRILTAANNAGLKSRDYACTFLGLLSMEGATLVLQVGDGGVVLDVGAGLELAVVPMSGEYANMTHFVTDEKVDAILDTNTKVYENRAFKVAAFTDGIQRLALNLTTNTPHEPFFSPFFDSMAKVTAEQEEQLQPLLVNFLGSQAVNERTDDDKTLALALWMS